MFQQGGGNAHFAADQTECLGIVNGTFEAVVPDGGNGGGQLQVEADGVVRPDDTFLGQDAMVGVAADVVQAYVGFGQIHGACKEFVE